MVETTASVPRPLEAVEIDAPREVIVRPLFKVRFRVRPFVSTFSPAIASAAESNLRFTRKTNWISRG